MRRHILSRPLKRSTLRKAALTYARHEWDVIPGARLERQRFRCERWGCPVTGCHPAFEAWEDIASHDVAQVAAWWEGPDFSVLLPTGRAFDVIELPAALARAAHEAMRRQRLACPTAITPNGPWLLFVAAGDALRPDLGSRLDIVWHTRGSWVPAPPTPCPDGSVRWHLSPAEAQWKLPDPYAVQERVAAAMDLAHVTGPAPRRNAM